jgi:hypothetical protein
MKSRKRRWWRSRFGVYIGVILILTVLFVVDYQGKYFIPSGRVSDPLSPPAPSLDWHDKRNWQANLSVGMTQAKVRQIFGEPEKVKVSHFVETWEYGSGEIVFADANLFNSAGFLD